MTRLYILAICFVSVAVGCGGGLRENLPDSGVNVVRPGEGGTAGARGGGGGSTGSAGSSGKDAPVAPDVPGAPDPSADTGGPPISSPGCDPGFHKCGDDCVDSRAVATCGIACEPCPMVTGGEPTCDGTRCGVKCPAGKKFCLGTNSCIGENEACDGNCAPGKNPCNGLCVAATEKTACGPSCVVCPTSPNGTTTCDGTECKLACNTGFHLCGTECKSNTSTDSCGTSCTPCKPAEGGGAACMNGACQATCPSGTSLCKSNGKCQPPGMSCDGTCPAGKHDCSGNCVDNNEVNNCGATSCTPCPVPANADATCDGKACGFKCKAGFHLCGDKCVPDTSTASCGTQCSPCASPANGTSTCTSGVCGQRCNDGFHLCGSTCRSNTDADACGASCTKCEAPANARAVCTNGACGFECTSGRKCNGQCIGNDVPCGTNCPTGYTLCNGKCFTSNGLPAEVCSNNADDDCDGQVDCKDSNCGNGTSCGGGRVCQSGSCEMPCSAQNGQTCDGNSCNPGKFDCAGNCANRQPKCPGQSCSNGVCCSVTTCAPPNQPCKTGKTTCPATSCMADGNKPAGTDCGGGRKCDANGVCMLPCGVENNVCCSGSKCNSGLWCQERATTRCKRYKRLGEDCIPEFGDYDRCEGDAQCNGQYLACEKSKKRCFDFGPQPECGPDDVCGGFSDRGYFCAGPNGPFH